MSTKVEFTIKQKTAYDPKWLGIELHEALDEKRLTNYWNEMIEDSELIPVDNNNFSHSKKGLTVLIYKYSMIKLLNVKYFCFLESSGQYYIGLWAVNCPCKDDPSDKECNCMSCKLDDDNEVLKSKQLFESLMWKPNCSMIFLVFNKLDKFNIKIEVINRYRQICRHR